MRDIPAGSGIKAPFKPDLRLQVPSSICQDLLQTIFIQDVQKMERAFGNIRSEWSFFGFQGGNDILGCNGRYG
jgi:hypothetical protein